MLRMIPGSPSNSRIDVHVWSPTMPSMASCWLSCHARTSASVRGPKMPSVAKSVSASVLRLSSVCSIDTCRPRSPLLSSGSLTSITPPGRIAADPHPVTWASRRPQRVLDTTGQPQQGGVMDTWVWIVIIIVAVLAAAARARRRRQLQRGFGPEYDRTLEDADSRRRAEAELQQRMKRHDQLELRPLEREERNRYLREWDGVQARFVDQPVAAIRDADVLIQRVMRDRGYPVDDFEQRAADLSVDHADVVDNYRAAHAVADRSAAGDATTEELRRAVVHYRVLFEELIGV